MNSVVAKFLGLGDPNPLDLKQISDLFTELLDFTPGEVQ